MTSQVLDAINKQIAGYMGEGGGDEFINKRWHNRGSNNIYTKNIYIYIYVLRNY